MKKSELRDFNLYRKVDGDCFQYWTLSQLHATLYPGDDTRRDSDDSNVLVQLVGEVFLWFVGRCRCKDKDLEVRFGNLEKKIVMKFAKGRLEDKQKLRAKWISRGNSWSTVLPGRELPSNIKYVVVDVETHDWGNECISRIVEIAWSVYDVAGNKLESKQYLLQPYAGYTQISDEAKNFHGITTKCARELGSDANLVFAEFVRILREIPEDGFVIAHNMKHEHSVFNNNLDQEQKVVWNNVPKCDTISKSLLRYLDDGNMYHRRRCGLKLSELHKNCFPNRHLKHGAHQALVDVQMTWEVFQFYKKKITELQGDEDLRAILKWRPERCFICIINIKLLFCVLLSVLFEKDCYHH